MSGSSGCQYGRSLSFSNVQHRKTGLVFLAQFSVRSLRRKNPGRPENRAGPPLYAAWTTETSIPPGTLFFSHRFEDEIFDPFNAPVDKIEYRITPSLGGPDVGKVEVSDG